jgi:hypothetical protein
MNVFPDPLLNLLLSRSVAEPTAIALVHFAPEPVDEEVALSPWYIGKGQGF